MSFFNSRPFTFIAFIVAACSPAPAARCPECTNECPIAPPMLRLYENRCYYVDNAPEGYMRGNGSLFYVMSENSGFGKGKIPLGLVRGTTRVGSMLFVQWYCRSDRNLDSVLSTEGLPVRGIAQDETGRVGKCVGKFEKFSNDLWIEAADAVNVRIDRGVAEGVKSGDRYFLLGAPVVEGDRVVTGADVLAECIVQSLDLLQMSASCSVERNTPETRRAFTRDQWEKGGVAVLRQDELPKSTCP